MIDTHCHLDDQEFEGDRAAVVARAACAGVEHMIALGTTAASSRETVRLTEKYPSLYAGVGIHPNSCVEAGPGDWDTVQSLLDHPRVVALGETGLDRYWDYSPIDLQRDYFDRHLRMSQQRDRAIVIHCRDAHAEMMPMLREAASRGPLRGVLHAFSGDAAMAAECLDLGLYVSFAGNVTYTNRKFQSLREAAVTIPADRILIETDSPYLTPEPFRGKQKRNEPALVAHTAAALARLRGVPLDEFARQTAANARRLFQLDAKA
ncbi:MAG: TatD family hydrolase [Thermoguttaceae bacterium]|jgi:TatD DNase family protein